MTLTPITPYYLRRRHAVMDPQFVETFKKSIQDQMAANEKARVDLENMLGSLRARTEQMMATGAAPAPFIPPATTPYQPMAAPLPSPTPGVVSHDWAKTVIQAATIDQSFKNEVGMRATQIVMAALNQPSPAVQPDSVPPEPDSS